jgi:Prohead core protein serine protease
MNKELLIDCISFDIPKDIINEAASKVGPFIVKGVLQRANAKNQNGRIYPRDILEREAAKYIDNFIKERRALGELDHPESQVVNLQNVSHNVIGMEWNGDDLVGTVEVLTTPSGNILKELFKSGIKLGISSRGMGSVKKNVRESADEVQNDFELIAFDFVSNPSTRGAFLYPDGQAPLQEGMVKNPITNKWEKTETIIRDILNNLN